MEDNALVLLLYVGRHKWKLLMSPLLLMLLRISPLASSFSEEEKVEEDTKVVYFLCFSVYRFVFVVSLFLTIQSLLYAEKVEEDTKATIFISFSSQTEKLEEDTKAAIFISKLSHFHLKQVCFLCFFVYKFIFFVSHNTKV
ncbi:hypothetical protein GmHk_14G041359 [Glycine max]|nr:hypothetical protein GmHk_14G041359 [Glycine max]